MNSHITIAKEQIEKFCRRNHIFRLGLFGSVLREDFQTESDIDVLVEFEQGQEPDLSRMLDLQDELAALFEHKVDLVERRAIERSENYIRRRHILESVETVYVAG
jgi:predicted nucleotidyltransferase